MDLAIEERKRQELRDLLLKLAKPECVEKLSTQFHQNEVFEALENIYHDAQGNQFKHYYSDIFSILTRIKNTPNLGTQYLGLSLQIIREQYVPRRVDSSNALIDIGDNIRKLYDHVSLDIARMDYSDSGDHDLQEEPAFAAIRAEIDSTNSSLESSKNELKLLEKNIANVSRSIASIHIDHVAILGIFSGIVLSFIGGLAFSTSVFEHLHEASIYRVVLVSLIVGLLLVNIFYAMFYYIYQIVGKKDSPPLTPLFISNTIILVLILATILGWKDGLVERRNQGITEMPNQPQQEEIISSTALPQTTKTPEKNLE